MLRAPTAFVGAQEDRDKGDGVLEEGAVINGRRVLVN